MDVAVDVGLVMPFGAIEKAVDVAVDVGLAMPLDVFERIGGGLEAVVGLLLDCLGIGDGLSDEVDIERERLVVPKTREGDASGECAKEVRFWS